MVKASLLAVSHLAALGFGFALGLYALPILIAPPAPSPSEVHAKSFASRFQGQFRRDLEGSGVLNWGEGTVHIGYKHIVLDGELAPGADYVLYLAPEFVQSEADFRRLAPVMTRVGEVRTFTNFIVPIPEGVDAARYTTVVVWSLGFDRFVTAARYR